MIPFTPVFKARVRGMPRWVFYDGGRARAGFHGVHPHDCVVRAVAIAGDFTYASVFERMARAYPNFANGSDGLPGDCMDDVLLPQGWVRKDLSRRRVALNKLVLDRRRVYILSLVEWRCGRRGRAPREEYHMCAVLDGAVFDQFDSRWRVEDYRRRIFGKKRRAKFHIPALVDSYLVSPRGGVK